MGLRIFGLGFGSYFRVRVGIESGIGLDKNTSLNPIFSFESNPTLLSVVVLSSPPSRPRLSLCKSSFSCCCVCVCLIFLSLCVLKMGKGIENFGKTHTLCVRCGHCSFYLQKSCCLQEDLYASSFLSLLY